MNYKSLAVGVVSGILGFSLAWGVWHMCVDHRNFHTLINAVVNQQQGEKK